MIDSDFNAPLFLQENQIRSEQKRKEDEQKQIDDRQLQIDAMKQGISPHFASKCKIYNLFYTNHDLHTKILFVLHL